MSPTVILMIGGCSPHLVVDRRTRFHVRNKPPEDQEQSMIDWNHDNKVSMGVRESTGSGQWSKMVFYVSFSP